MLDRNGRMRYPVEMTTFASDTRITHFSVITASGDYYIIGFTQPNSKKGSLDYVMSTPGVNKEYSEAEFGAVIKTWEDWKHVLTAHDGITVRTLISGTYSTVPVDAFISLIDEVLAH